jgi:ferredoxin
MEEFVNCGSVHLENSACIRSRFTKSRCEYCFDVCPVGAITLKDSVKIDQNSCIKCGLCYAVCPFSAISIKKDNSLLLKKTHDKETVDIGCIFADSEIKVACISRISEDLLAHWFAEGKNISIKKANCKKCKLNNTIKYFNDSFKKAVIIAKSINAIPKIKIQTKISKNVHIPKETLSRREMFLSINPIKNSYTKRKFIFDIVHGSIKNDLPYPDSADIKISKSCNICGLCEHICPLNAILIEKKDKTADIYFNPYACIACGECAEGCIYNAIKIVPSNISKITKKPYKVFSADKKICSKCGSVFYSNKDESLCLNCQTKETRKENLIDFFKNI